MFERGLKRHSYQLWEVKFQCPANESAAETEQRLSSQLARYILPSRGPSYPPPLMPRPKPSKRNAAYPPPPHALPLSLSLPFVGPRVSSGRFLVQIKLIFEGPTLFSYEFHIGAPRGMEMFSRAATHTRRGPLVKARAFFPRFLSYSSSWTLSPTRISMQRPFRGTCWTMLAIRTRPSDPCFQSLIRVIGVERKIWSGFQDFVCGCMSKQIVVR